MTPQLIPSPAFVLDERALEANLTKLRKVKEEAGIQLILAFKGFALWKSFPLVRQFLDGATASSLHEAQLCFDEMKCKAHTYMVAYKTEEFETIVNLSSHITFNSLTQYRRFESQLPDDISVGLRVNPEWSDVETPLYNPASPNSRLGVTAASLPAALPDRIEGLHFHVLCESSAESLVRVLENFERKFERYIPHLKWVNMGGGHLITKAGYNTALLVKVLQDFSQRHDLEVILEPGSAIAWETGDLYTSVLDVVENGGEKTAIIDASFTCHMPDCLEMPYRPIIDNAHMDASCGKYQYRIGGISCLAGDYLDAYGFDEPLNVGDKLIFRDMMHYTMVKTTTFNGIQHPAIGMRKKDGSIEILREFSYKDYKDRLS